MTAADPMTAAVVAILAGLLGLGVGHLIRRAADRFPWPASKRSWWHRGGTPRDDGVSAPRLHDRGGAAVGVPVIEAGTALLFGLAALRFGLSWELPAFLFFTAAGVLLAVIDLEHHLLPNRVVLPSISIGALLLLAAALAEQEWAALLRAVMGAAVLFAAFLVLALISPRGLGMGDVKLAGLIGLYLGWVGWSAVFLGAVAGFVLQALLALVLLAGRRIGLRGDLPFGPAMLLGAAVVLGWSDTLLG